MSHDEILDTVVATTSVVDPLSETSSTAAVGLLASSNSSVGKILAALVVIDMIGDDNIKTEI